MTDQQAVEGAVSICRAIAEAIKELGSVPSGHLYARLMDKMSLDVYETLINVLVTTKQVKRNGNVLVYCGK